jgi:hypothetical protein
MSRIAITGNPSGGGVFTISAPNGNTDRTLVLPDEAGTVLTSVSDIAAAKLTGALPAISGADLTNLPASGLGVGQTWTNVTSSRATGTTYTNSTGRPIFVSVVPNASAGLIGSFFINNVFVANSQDTPSGGGGGGSNFTYVIPNGDTYKAVNNQNFVINQWWELR